MYVDVIDNMVCENFFDNLVFGSLVDGVDGVDVFVNNVVI